MIQHARSAENPPTVSTVREVLGQKKREKKAGATDGHQQIQQSGGDMSVLSQI